MIDNVFEFKGGKLINDHFQNFKVYGIPHAQLIIPNVRKWALYDAKNDITRKQHAAQKQNHLVFSNKHDSTRAHARRKQT